jgi:hypothetical protein
LIIVFPIKFELTEKMFSEIDALILQESIYFRGCPTPSFGRSKLSFIFDSPVFFHDLGVLNMYDSSTFLLVTYTDGVSEEFNFIRDGMNAAHRVIVSKPNVQMLELVFTFGSGAVTELSFCSECTAKAGHDDSHGCIVAANNITQATEFIEENNFENTDSIEALKGWENAWVEQRAVSSFSKFLGLYNVSTVAPYKVFLVPRTAKRIIIELDFYEIDNWTPEDSMAIFVDGEKLAMTFDQTFDEGSREGRNQLGINWTSVSYDTPKHLGFSSLYLDQKHRITIEAPSTTQLFTDGQMRITLSCSARRNETVSCGWDNVKVNAKYGCTSFNSTNV